VRPTLEGADPRPLLDAANVALRSSGLPELSLLEIARCDAEYPVGVTGKVLKRRLRERYTDLTAYVAQASDRILAVAESDAQPAAAAS
jgi:hypothetical protein